MLVAGFSLAAVVSAAAQVSPQTSPWNSEPDESAAEAAPDASDADIMKDIDVSKLDWSQLSADASTLDGPSPKTSPAAKRATGSDTSWSSNEKPNGTSAVSVKQSLSPFWDTRIGADMTVARQGTLTTSEILSEKLANGGNLPQSSGTAWAAITAPGVASIWDKTSLEAASIPDRTRASSGRR